MKKNMKKISNCIIYLGFIATITILHPVIVAENINEKSPEIHMSQKSNDYEWVYKTINGVKYKRLFNVSTGEWASDWIKA